MKYYRFSISWSRVLSNGTLASRNEEGIQFYKNLVQELKNNNIEPVVTLYHWDLPQKLQDMGITTHNYHNSVFIEFDSIFFLFVYVKNLTFSKKIHSYSILFRWMG